MDRTKKYEPLRWSKLGGGTDLSGSTSKKYFSVCLPLHKSFLGWRDGRGNLSSCLYNKNIPEKYRNLKNVLSQKGND